MKPPRAANPYSVLLSYVSNGPPPPDEPSPRRYTFSSKQDHLKKLRSQGCGF